MSCITATYHDNSSGAVTLPVYFTLPVGYPVNMLRIDPRWVSATKGTTFGAGLFVRVIVF